MQTQLERECKWAIDEAGYHVLLQHCMKHYGHPLDLRQENLFFDSPDRRLRRMAMSLRIRQENHRLLLTVKQRGKRDGPLHQQHEEQCWLNVCLWPLLQDPHLPLAEILPLPKSLRLQLGSAPLHCLGGFRNRRQQWSIGDDLLCLDQSDFDAAGGHTEYEIEVELGASDSSCKAWQSLLTETGASLRTQHKTKLQRYIEGQAGQEAQTQPAGQTMRAQDEGSFLQ